MSEMSLIVRNYLEAQINSPNPTINIVNLISINKDLNLGLTVSEEIVDNNVAPPLIRNNCLDEEITLLYLTNPYITVKLIEEIVNSRIELDNTNPICLFEKKINE